MFVAIVGTRYAGKSTIRDYLVSRGFTSISLDPAADESTTPTGPVFTKNRRPGSDSFLSMNSPATPSASPVRQPQSMHFSSSALLLDYVTERWRLNFVTTDLKTKDHLESFSTRPFFLLLQVDAPIMVRYRRAIR